MVFGIMYMEYYNYTKERVMSKISDMYAQIKAQQHLLVKTKLQEAIRARKEQRQLSEEEREDYKFSDEEEVSFTFDSNEEDDEIILDSQPTMDVIGFIIEDILPIGLHIFCGAPKVGKSWLMLDICIRVSKGEEIWNLKTNKCDVLYLALERDK